ncbi:S-layer homology domain-containing protein [Heyndrickxia oleronia]|uniref:SLH domain-containing protein n=1 Tax=Heyndrickxia oleronia TaxID=38875 RepID=A0A8E2LBC3_9BACI|nr:S-layer homology domain-containing protein [Heyndrickxia oleronia]MEC1375869.1 S-layer homology domain-containing protein [Heyndrickxia oleronia]OOP65785.1 hypothetical protein BWZ43_24405 [Heyndrickxia oleronia]QQZ05586.1 S-layer homology domain-containing protein [Heyndrickxia oleronia]
MKKFLKFSSLFVAGICLFNLFLFEHVQAATKSYTISDMRSGSSGFDEISDFLASDTIDGFVDPKTGAMSFKPNQNVTRAQFAKLLLNAMGIQPQKEKQKFSDVIPSQWYADYVNTASELGIILGNTDGTFKPDNNITRGQIAAMLVRAFNGTVSFPKTTNQSFSDVSSKTTFVNEINQAASLKIIRGFEDGSFKPENPATRGQAVVMIYRTLAQEKPNIASNQEVKNVVTNYLKDVNNTYTSTDFEASRLTNVFDSYGSGYFYASGIEMIGDIKKQIQNNSQLVLQDSSKSIKADVLFLSDRYADILISNAPIPNVKNSDGKLVELENLNENGLYSLKKTANGWKIYNFKKGSDGISSPRVKKTLNYIVSKEESIKLSGVSMEDSIIDPNKPYIYMIDKKKRQLITINYENKKTKVVPLNYEPSGLSLSEDGSKLYIVNKSTKYLLSIYNPSTNAIETNLTYEVVDTQDNSGPRHVYAHDHKIFVVDGSWAPKLIVLNADTYQPIDIPKIEGIGSMVFSKDNKQFYYWYQYGWNAGWAKSNIYKYSIDGDKLTAVDNTNNRYPDLDRDPLDAPIILLEDKNLVISKTHMFDANDLSLLNIFPEPIYAASSDLNIAVGKNGVYNLTNTLQVNDFDFTGYVIQKMDFKQNDLFLFRKNGNDIIIDRMNIEEA